MGASVLISTYESRKTIGRSLKSLIDQGLSSKEYEIIVLDPFLLQGEDFEVVNQFVVSHKNITLIREHLSIPELYNLGARRARGEYLLFIAAHCIARGDWVKRHLSFGMGSGDIVNAPASSLISRLEGVFNTRFREQIIAKNRNVFIDYHNAMIPRGLYLKEGGVDTVFSSVYALSVLGMRLHAKGFVIPFQEDNGVVHFNQTKLVMYVKGVFEEGFDQGILAIRYPDLARKYLSHPKLLRHLGLWKIVRHPLYWCLTVQVFCSKVLFYLIGACGSLKLQEHAFLHLAKQAHRQGQIAGICRVLR